MNCHIRSLLPLLLVLAAFAFHGPVARAAPACHGKFANPITDICWSCTFPMSIGSMSLIKGGRNPEQARRWYEFALTPEFQALAAQAKSYQTPSHPAASVPPQAPKLAEMKLIDYDFAKYGSSAERQRLVARWEKDVASQPK